MNKKCWMLFSLGMVCGLLELILKIVIHKNFDILSVLLCSFGLLFFFLFIIALEQSKKVDK